MDRASEAAAMMAERKMNCAQAVLTSFAGELGLPRVTALGLAQGFGAGMGRTGGVCGAVSAACMVLGLRPYPEVTEARARVEKVYSMVQEFKRNFEALHGSVLCPRLLGYDLSKPEELAQARAQGVLQSVCPRLVADAVTLLETLA